MKTKTITVSEYASRYGCSREYVTRNLRADKGMVGMLRWRKLDGRTGSWLIEVLISWYQK